MSSSRAADGRPRARFRPGLALTACALLGFALLLTLGTWQVQRLAWKTDLIARAEERMASAPADMADLEMDAGVDFRRVTATGTYLHDTAFVLGISGRDGEPGGTLVTPLRLEDGRVLLVERGWVPESAFPPHTPEALEPQGPQEVSGILRWRGDARPNPFTPASDPERRQFYWHDLEGMANLVGEPLLPAVLVRTGAPGGLPATPAVAVDYRSDHLSYAITWYSLAAILVVFYVMVGLRRGQG